VGVRRPIAGAREDRCTAAARGAEQDGTDSTANKSSAGTTSREGSTVGATIGNINAAIDRRVAAISRNGAAPFRHIASSTIVG